MNNILISGLLAVSILALAACTRTQTETVHLKHSATGATLRCGPYIYEPGSAEQLLAQKDQKDCVSYFRKQGYQPTSP